MSDKQKTIQVLLWLRVEKNNKYIRMKGKTRSRIEETILSQYDMQKTRPDGWDVNLGNP
jgi:hypothetical protein